MCVDYKNLKKTSRFSLMWLALRQNISLNFGRIVRAVVVVALVIALIGVNIKLFPAAVDQMFTMSLESSATASMLERTSLQMSGQQMIQAFETSTQLANQSSEHYYHPSTHAWTFVED